ncbi:MAG: hypothetical protein R3F39_11690 [Myxococcota bacterium]
MATITASRTVRGGLNPGGDAFGLMDPTFTFRALAHTVKDGKVHLTATMHCDYHWGVHGLGNTDVPSGTAPFITGDNYEAIADDIDPRKGANNSAPYTAYWSKAATEAHELEHARDDWEDWAAQTTGVAIAKAGFEAETVRAASIDADLTALQTTGGGGGRHPGKINSAVMDGSDVHYGAALGYHARPGEIKAHAVGATIERPLSDAVRAHGKKLVADAKAKADADAKAKAAETKAGEAGGADDKGGGKGEGAGRMGASARRKRLGGSSADRTVAAIMGLFD